MRRATLPAAVLVTSLTACAPPVHRTTPVPPSPRELAALWIDPGPAPRDLFDGAGAPSARPRTDATYTVLRRDTSGFSITYRVRDARGREWHVKIGPEAQPEVVASRIVWALGYHQLPSYFVERWIAVQDGRGQMLGGGRFRPHDMPLKARGTWSWHENPFVGTQPYRGLLVLMTILNSTDLKDANNAVYDVAGPPREHAAEWYVVKDLGASLGETGRMDPLRGDVNAFEREPFIIGVKGPWVSFAFRGRHQELLDHLTPDDVRWTCARLARLTDRQWRDAFRAGGYDAAQTRRFVARIREKIARGLELDAAYTGAP